MAIRRLMTLAGALALGAGVTSAPALADDNDEYVRYIALYNWGGYNIDPVILKWKRDGKVYDKKMGAKIGKGELICIDLTKIDDIQEGDQVWVVAKIEAGETESCKKDRKRLFDPDTKEMWDLEMGGTTFNNNRCQNSNGDYSASDTQKGNSTDCLGIY